MKGTRGVILKLLQLGPFLINIEILIFILSAFAGYMAMKFRLSKADVKGDISGKFFVALILGFFVWKFSIVLFDPISTFQQPLSLLYFNGGNKGIGLAVVITTIFLGIRTRMDGTSIMMNLDILGTGWIVSSSVYHLLLIFTDSTNLLYNSLYISLNIGFAIFLYKKKEAVGNSVVINQFIVWISLGMIGILFTKDGRELFILGFTKEQILFFVVFIIFYIVDIVMNKEKGGS